MRLSPSSLVATITQVCPHKGYDMRPENPRLEKPDPASHVVRAFGSMYRQVTPVADCVTEVNQAYPYRHETEEGLYFLAFSRSLTELEAALIRMAGIGVVGFASIAPSLLRAAGGRCARQSVQNHSLCAEQLLLHPIPGRARRPGSMVLPRNDLIVSGAAARAGSRYSGSSSFPRGCSRCSPGRCWYAPSVLPDCSPS